jgi:hypothetical protein
MAEKMKSFQLLWIDITKCEGLQSFNTLFYQFVNVDPSQVEQRSDSSIVSIILIKLSIGLINLFLRLWASVSWRTGRGCRICLHICRSFKHWQVRLLYGKYNLAEWPFFLTTQQEDLGFWHEDHGNTTTKYLQATTEKITLFNTTLHPTLMQVESKDWDSALSCILTRCR